MAEVVCRNCGHRNPLGANFCSSCGSALEVDRSDHTTLTFQPEVLPTVVEPDVGLDVDDLPTGSGMLVVVRGPNAGSRFLLGHDVTTAGRHPDSDIFLDDVTVSRRHAEVVRSAHGYVVRDVGSLNGTYLNRHRIEQADLAPGDELQIGKYRLQFHTAAS